MPSPLALMLVSHQVVADLLHELGYSLQADRKTKEGSGHPDRNAQFEHLNGKVKWSLSRRQPVISVDTKKKELVGDFNNGGRELRLKGEPEKVRVHDFIDPELGRWEWITTRSGSRWKRFAVGGVPWGDLPTPKPRVC